MKVNYKGFEITAEREKSLGGWDNLYYTVMRISDGWFMHDSFTEDSSKIRDFIGYLKENVDSYYENPSEWEDEEEEN